MANLNIRVDDDLKKDAENLFAELGMNMSTAMTIFLKQAIRCGGIPFDLRIDPFYSAENQARLLAAKERMERTGGTVHDLIEVDND